jgi:UDP-N-acetylglucosamine acyltransferase
MAKIHPTAIIDPRAELAEDVTIGAFCIIKGVVRIGSGTRIEDQTHVHGSTVIGRNCRLGPAAYIGMDPQVLKYAGEPTHLTIGDGVIIRETASVHRSALPGPEHCTRVGDRCMMMVGSHIAHDCQVGSDVVMANAVLLAGHVTIGDRCVLGGGFTLHQFCRVGRLTVIAGNEALSQDVPPFAAVRDRSLKGYNAIGCRRSGMGQETVVAIRAAYRCLRTNRQVTQATAAIRAEVPPVPEVMEIVEFIEGSRRGIVPTLLSLRMRRTGSEGFQDELTD